MPHISSEVLKLYAKNTHFCLLQEGDVRIIVGLFEEDLSSEVFCCVSTLCGHLAGLMKIQVY